MAQVQGNNVVPTRDPSLDRGDTNCVGRACRIITAVIRSKWLASFVVAFAVSWGFHVVEERSDAKIEHQQHVTACVVADVALEQQRLGPERRVRIGPILKVCEEREDK